MTYRRRRGLGGGSGGRKRDGSATDTGPGRGSERDAATGRAGRVPTSSAGRRGGVDWKRSLVAAAVVGACFLGGYLVAGAWLGGDGATVAAGPLVDVPELVGLSEEEARGRTLEAGLEFEVRSGIAHPRAPEGAVLAQSPIPGQRVRPGAPVEVTLSRGPEQYTLPDVSGLSERQATIVLERLGFRVAARHETHSTPAGRAFGTEPVAGAQLAVPADVSLLISDGPGLAEVPDLTGRHIDDALRLLGEAELSLGALSYDPRSLDAPGRIVGQYPPGGYSLRRGDPVEVRVAGDPDQVNRSRSRPLGDGAGPGGPDST